jgi:CheY-like chemotaxis protein
MVEGQRIYRHASHAGASRVMSSATVLLVEDNEQNRYLVTFLLERAGYEVVLAPDGPRAIEIAQTVPLDLILLDIQLPKMDGYEVARALRGMPSLGDIPIVAVTSYAMVGDREKTLAAGCSGYIEKPINPATFAAQVAGFLR